MITLIVISYIISFIFAGSTIWSGWISKDRLQFYDGWLFLLLAVSIGFVFGWILVILFVANIVRNYFDKHFND